MLRFKEEHLLSELHELARLVKTGMKVALPVDYAGVSMVLTKAIVENGAGDLHLVCVPTGGLQADILIGAGLVRCIETSAVTLGEAGAAPRFNHAVQCGGIAILDSTCPAIHAGLMAAQKGVPFLPMRGLIGSDILRHRRDWGLIDNPFSNKTDPIVLIPAIAPDIAIFHAPMADKFGNVWVGRRRELAAMSYASRQTIVTVERLVDHSLLDDELTAAGTLPSIYVTGVALAPKGAWPYGLWGEYPSDFTELKRYAGLARTKEGFVEYMGTKSMELEQ